MGTGGGAPTAQPPRCPTPPNGSYGRDTTTSLRSSLSVPVFSTYLKVDSSLVSNLPPLPGLPPRVPKRGSYLLQWKAAIGFLLTALLLLFLGFLLGKSYWKTDGLQYAIVIDGGSTGTRVHVYAWAHSPKDALPVMVKPTYDSAPWYRVPGQKRAYKRVETEPGLDKTLNNATAVEHALQPLLDWGEKQIPPYARGSTRLFLLATAGLRRLDHSQSDSILENAFQVLRKSPLVRDNGHRIVVNCSVSCSDTYITPTSVSPRIFSSHASSGRHT